MHFCQLWQIDLKYYLGENEMKKEKKTPKGKPQNNKEKNQKNQKAKKPSKILPIISRLMPYILAVLFVYV